MYFNIDWKNDKSPALTANNLNWLQTQFEEMVKQILEKKKDKTIPLGIRVDIDPNEAKVGEIFYLTGDDTQQKLSFTSGKTFYAFLQDPSGRLRYNYNGVEWRFKMVDKETACYLLQVGTEQEDDAGHGTPPGVSDNPYNPANKEYTIYYYTNGGTTIENQVVAGGSVITAPAGETTKAGYDFEGWFLDTDYTEPVQFPFEVYGNVNFYAKWVETAKTYYTVTFITNGGVAIQDMSIAEGEFINEPVTTREGCDFVGWYLDSAFATDMVIFPLQITADTTLYAKWEDATVYKTITYIYGVDDYSTIQVPVGTYATLETPTKDGYDFNGWYLENTYENKVESPMLVEDNTVLYAKWTEAIKYCTITYICPICKIVGASPTQVVKGSQLTNVSYGVESGYTPEGLYLDADYTQELQLPMVVENDLTIYIKATADILTISMLNIRYIKWMQTHDSSTITKPANVFNELQAIDSSGNNVALNKPVKYSWDENGWTTGALVNNGDSATMSHNTSSTNFTFSGVDYNYGRNSTITIDLETPTNLNSIKRWSYHDLDTANQITRIRHDKVYVSEDGITYYKIADETVNYQNTGDTGVEITLSNKLVSQCPILDLSYTVKDMGIRYLRWTSSSNKQGWSTVVAELECYDDAGTNIALAAENKMVRRTKSDGTFVDWNWTSPDTTAVDGNTYYNTSGGTGAMPGKYWELDLGKTYNVKRVVYYPYFSSNTYYDFKFEVSNDGINYYVIDNYLEYYVSSNINSSSNSSYKTQRALGTPLKYYLDEINPNDLEICTTPTGQETTE